MKYPTIERKSTVFLIESIIKNLSTNVSSDIDSKVIELLPELEELSTILNVSNKSALLFCQFFDLSIRNISIISVEDLSKYDIDFFALAKLSEQIQELISKGLLIQRKSIRESIGFSIPTTVINSLLFNKPFSIKTISGLPNNRFYRFLKNSFTLYDKNEIDFMELHSQLKTLVESNPELPLPKVLESLNVSNGFFLMAMCNQIFEYGSSSISLNEFLWRYNNLEFDNLFIEDKSDEIDFSRLENELKSSSSELLRKEIIKNKKGESFKTVYTYELNPKIKEVLFKNVSLLFEDENEFNGSNLIRIISHEEISPVELIYDEETISRLNEFQEYFSGDNMRLIMERYSDLGIQPNFCAMLSGPSGSGKSEWIKQLCRDSRRRVFQVNLSEVKNCYVGISEKNIQSIFDDYKSSVGQVMNIGKDTEENRIPILVIDEAEILMGDRSKFGRRSSVEEMHKMMVNILLKNLEDFTGILLLTSNNVLGIDPALSRRINYKFSIPNPSAIVRGRILYSVMNKWFSETDCFRLGGQYELNGGMVKNIHQKVINNYVLKGNVPSLDTIEKWCEEESQGFIGMKIKNPIGFNTNR